MKAEVGASMVPGAGKNNGMTSCAWTADGPKTSEHERTQTRALAVNAKIGLFFKRLTRVNMEVSLEYRNYRPDARGASISAPINLPIPPWMGTTPEWKCL